MFVFMCLFVCECIRMCFTICRYVFVSVWMFYVCFCVCSYAVFGLYVCLRVLRVFLPMCRCAFVCAIMLFVLFVRGVWFVCLFVYVCVKSLFSTWVWLCVFGFALICLFMCKRTWMKVCVCLRLDVGIVLMCLHEEVFACMFVFL